MRDHEGNRPTTSADLDARHRTALPDSVFAFPDKRKEPLTDASHCATRSHGRPGRGRHRGERELAFANIKKAAHHYDVDMTESNWRELGAGSRRRTRRAALTAVRPAARTPDDGNSSPRRSPRVGPVVNPKFGSANASACRRCT
jgi:hypothetical protein